MIYLIIGGEVIIASANGLSTVQHLIITRTNADILPIPSLSGTNFSEVWIKMQKISFKIEFENISKLWTISLGPSVLYFEVLKGLHRPLWLMSSGHKMFGNNWFKITWSHRNLGKKNISDWSSHHMVEVNHIYVVMPYVDIDLGTWWCHQMETFSALLAICAGNSPVPGEFPTQRPVTRSFDVFFDLCLNKRLSKQWWGWWFEMLSCPLWRHRNAVPNQVMDCCMTPSPYRTNAELLPMDSVAFTVFKLYW